MKTVIDQALNFDSVDINSNIPDVDRMCNYIYDKLPLYKYFNENEFRKIFFHHLGDENKLKNSFYENLEKDINSFIKTLETKFERFSLLFWTQGNIFLQTRKAETAKSLFKEEIFYDPFAFVSRDKKALLPDIFRKLTKEDFELICLMDDTLENIHHANEINKAEQNKKAEFLILQKIRHDKGPKQKIIKEQNQNLQALDKWHEIEEAMLKRQEKSLALILDLDGVIYNSTAYKNSLKASLTNLIEEIVPIEKKELFELNRH